MLEVGGDDQRGSRSSSHVAAEEGIESTPVGRELPKQEARLSAASKRERPNKRVFNSNALFKGELGTIFSPNQVKELKEQKLRRKS